MMVDIWRRPALRQVGASVTYQGKRGFRWRAIMAEAQINRPLSPHIQIYKWTLPFLMSGFHRATGFALYFGFVLVAWWLVAAASGPSAYANVQWFYGTFIGRLVLFGYTWGLIHHTLGGIRHLIWDTSHGFSPREITWLARATIGGSIALTFAVWALGYLVMSGPR
jgi:succinate dehydrogenase / fumarate reductase cytochrome b subunit